MSSLDFEQIIYLARAWCRMGQSMEEFFTRHGISEDVQRRVTELITPARILVARDIGEGVGPGVDVTWADRLREHDWHLWSAHEHFLRFVLRRPADVIESISEQSELILRRIPDPARARFKGKGLVIGYIQSGKTANYTAVAARAVDAGYKLVIVLSGIHNNLRAQTQRRLDRELIGRILTGESGIERPPHGLAWIRLTERGDSGDFSGTTDPAILEGQQPVIAVIKKNCKVLGTLLEWLRSVEDTVLFRCPALIVDDEADQASVNTGQDRPIAEREQEAAIEDEASPSETNRLIRLVIKRLPCVAYLAYTATPFANVLIDPQGEDREAGDDLFPADFIHQLPRPPDYTGTREMFGGQEDAQRDVLRLIPHEDMDQLRPQTARARSSWHPEMCSSLSRAIMEFLLGGAVRIHRGHGDKPHTMLVHTTHFTESQGRLAALIGTHIDGLKGEIEFGTGAFINAMRALWNNGFHQSLVDGAEIEFSDLLPNIREIVRKTRTLELNSASNDQLDFELGPSLSTLAVGGNRLSRGLTLEGLTVSVFVRTTNMADTLLQMARWYGYRTGYEDLIRLYTTQDIASWFSELALVEDDLRDEVDRLAATGLTPLEQGFRLRAHSALLLTSRAKSQHAVTQRVGWSGTHPQNIVLPVHHPECLASDFEAAKRLAEAIDLRVLEGGLIANDVQAGNVAGFIREITKMPETRTFDRDALASWIERQVSLGRLNQWTVFFPTNGDASAVQISFCGHEIGLNRRSRLRQQNSIGVLVDPRHEAIDLLGGAEAFRRGSDSYDTRAMRQARSPSAGLLLVYLLDPASDSVSRGRERLVPEDVAAPPAVVGVALSLPFLPEDDAQTVVIGGHFADA